MQTQQRRMVQTAAFQPLPGSATYAATKAFVLNLSEAVHEELKGTGVTLTAVCPGPVSTPLLKELFAKDPEQAERRLVHVPMGRFAEAEEIAHAMLFLASDESSYITASAFIRAGTVYGGFPHCAIALVAITESIMCA